MKKTFLIWITGSLINLVYMWVLIWGLGYFVDSILTPIIWMVINFVPISLVIGYYTYKHVNVESKMSNLLLIIFILSCFGIALFSRHFADFSAFEKSIQYTPYFLIPLQLIILVVFFKQGNIAEMGNLGSENEPLNIEKIRNMTQNDILVRIQRLSKKKRAFQEEYDIASDASIKFSLKENISILDKDIEILKEQFQSVSKK